MIPGLVVLVQNQCFKPSQLGAVVPTETASRPANGPRLPELGSAPLRKAGDVGGRGDLLREAGPARKGWFCLLTLDLTRTVQQTGSSQRHLIFDHSSCFVLAELCFVSLIRLLGRGSVPRYLLGPLGPPGPFNTQHLFVSISHRSHRCAAGGTRVSEPRVGPSELFCSWMCLNASVQKV